MKIKGKRGVISLISKFVFYLSSFVRYLAFAMGTIVIILILLFDDFEARLYLPILVPVIFAALVVEVYRWLKKALG